jgi:hypothetical protein
MCFTQHDATSWHTSLTEAGTLISMVIKCFFLLTTGSAHPKDEQNIKNLRVKFFPVNTTMLQPMD